MRDRYTPPLAECERWLRTDVAAAYDKLKADPSRGLTINEGGPISPKPATNVKWQRTRAVAFEVGWPQRLPSEDRISFRMVWKSSTAIRTSSDLTLTCGP